LGKAERIGKSPARERAIDVIIQHRFGPPGY